MRNYKYIIPTIFACILFYMACEENERGPISRDSTIPEKISNVQIERLPGAVKLTYDIPKDNALSYVKAECVINGTVREVKASIYKNNLTIEGFADTTLYTVNLYSVNRSEVINPDPVVVRVQPLNPPFQDVYKTLNLHNDFGGATVFFENPTEAELAITLMYIDSLGYWNTGETAYTKKLEGSVSIRNLDTIPKTFGVYIRDRWFNTTDTLTDILTPLFEQELDKSFFVQWNLPTDEPSAYGWTIPMLWDGSIADGSGFHTGSTTWPQWITFDLGVTVKLSRFRYWQRQAWDAGFADRNVKKMEIWGSMNPNSDGSWDNSWEYLTTAESKKPSGLPLGQVSDEDIQLLNDGEEFTFPLEGPVIRYIRVKVLETWAGTIGAWYIMEFSFWGAEQ
jgi:hypothetical protein